jgi:hypothetical protein
MATINILYDITTKQHEHEDFWAGFPKLQQTFIIIMNSNFEMSRNPNQVHQQHP